MQPLVSLQYELNMMPLRWEGRKRFIEFWIKVMRMDKERLMKVVMLEALEMGGKVKWVQNLEENLRMFRWGGMSSEALEGSSMGEVKKVLTEVAWREIRGVWRQEEKRHPKLDLIGRLMEECEGCGMMVKDMTRRRTEHVEMKQLEGR